MWAGERDTRCQGPAGPTSMPLHVRPRIKVALGAEPSSAGLAGGSMAAGPWGLAGQQVLLEYICIPTSLDGWPGIPLSKAPPRLLPSSAGLVEVPPALCPLPSPVPLLLVPAVSLRPTSCSAQPVCLCPWSLLLSFSPSPQGSLPADTLSPWSYLLLLHLSLLFPTSPPEPSSLWALSGSPIPLPALAWSPCPCVPRSPCVGGDRGVSREESVCFSAPAAGWLPW